MPESTDTAVTGRTSKAILLIPILVGWVFLSEGIQKFLFPEDEKWKRTREPRRSCWRWD